MTKERTPQDYMAKDRFVVGSDDAGLSDGAVFSDKPLPGEGSVYMAGSDTKAGAGRGKRGGPTAKEVEGKKTGGKIKAKGWGQARGSRAAKVY